MKQMRMLYGLVLFLLTASLAYSQRGADYVTMGDGAWCWFSDPRAVYDELSGLLFFGFTSSEGDIVVATYDYQTGIIDSTIIIRHLERDDHMAPSLLFLPNGRLMVFFTHHNEGFYYTTSLKSRDISAFEPVKNVDVGRMMCYTNPLMLSEENNRIYLFFQGGHHWKPSYVYSDDLGKSWSGPITLVAKPGASNTNRPYVKVASDGKSSIWFAFTDGHPRKEICNSIYYLKYEHGRLYDAAGKEIRDTAHLPVNQNMVPKVYDGEKTGIRAWIWDIAIDQQNHPVMVYATFPEDSKHYYNYAYWDGTEWNNYVLGRAGSWFPRYIKKKEDYEPEPHYSGGIYLDHNNPQVVYLSRPHSDIFEIERWETKDHGRTWDHTMVTENSERDNVRPFVVRNYKDGLLPSVLWMNLKHYSHYSDFISVIKGNKSASLFSGDITPENVTKVMQAVADWQIGHFDPPRHHPLHWTNGALYAGMFAWSQQIDDPKYMNWLVRIGKKYHWQPGFRIYHADDYVVTQTFLDIYKIKKDDRMLTPTKARVCWIMDHPSHTSMDFRNSTPYTTDRWSWCDALFMAPPVYARLYAITGNKNYMKFMNKEFKVTYDYLYDKDEHLFYRDSRYFDKREANGKKVFWGRGNGWVMGGLVRILQELPAGNKYRPFYEQLYREMAAKVSSLQDENGYWHASLLDPESYPDPETSSSGFFTYALAWGINAGLLNKEQYLPVVRKGWRALVRAVYADGKLGWVQQIGADPKKVTKSMTEVYGVGAFLLAGSEVYKLTMR